MVGIIMVVGAQTCYALLHSVSDLKAAAAPINMQRCLIREFMLNELKLGSKVVNGTKNICHTKGEGDINNIVQKPDG